MTLRFRQTFTLFPGVRINIGKRGISTSIGVPGATINIGRQGVRATVGAPGTGLSYSTPLLSLGHGVPLSSHDDSTELDAVPGFAPRNTPSNAKVYMPQGSMNEIASASVEVLTSASLMPLRDLIAKAREQRAQVKEDLKEACDEEARQKSELDRRKGSFFRWFYRRRIAELEAILPFTKAEVERLATWEGSTKIAVAFEVGDAAQRAYATMVRTFNMLKLSAKKWDVTADRQTDQHKERTSAVRTVSRIPITFEFSSTDLIQFTGRAMRFQNANGDDILLYPGVAVMPRVDDAFALIDLRDLAITGETRGFHETEVLPSDAQVIGQTWTKTNKDGSPDRRFKGNFQIPICAYGNITFRSNTGLTEEYMVSNAETAIAFAEAVRCYQQALDDEGEPS